MSQERGELCPLLEDMVFLACHTAKRAFPIWLIIQTWVRRGEGWARTIQQNGTVSSSDYQSGFLYVSLFLHPPLHPPHHTHIPILTRITKVLNSVTF